VALVTGAGSGIGRAVALTFVTEGAVVAFADRDLEGAQRAVREAAADERAFAVRVDIADESSVRDAYADVAARGLQIDVVVANAGVQLFGQDAAVGDLSLDTWERTLRVNLTGTFLTLKHAVRAMRASGKGGSIIVTGSPTGIVGSARGFTAYSSSKAAVHGLVRVVAADYAGHGIRVNTVVPGYTETPLVNAIVSDVSARAAIIGTTPLGRAGTAEDVVGAMVFLASSESSYATGSMVIVDGGATAV
jgi:NAD(P)-dependent dehydrogenase (short-subunit alcohol dehydrogenase family)